jgi:hypothetical protein
MRPTTSRHRSGLLSAAAVGVSLLVGGLAALLVGRSGGTPALIPPGTLLAQFQIEEGTDRMRHRLPGRLQEISGLARVPAGLLLAHDDERARLHRLHAGTGEVVDEFRLDEDGMRGDFEGVAVGGGFVYLTDSDGIVRIFPEGAPDARVPFETLDTGVGERCEVEGLAFVADPARLLLACKRIRMEGLRGGLTVFTVPLGPSGAEAPEPLLDLAPEALSALGLPRRLSLSGLEVHEDTGHMVVIASREGRIVEIGRDGSILAWARLRSGPHPQPEAITFTENGDLAIGDEGSGGSARLTVYPRQSDEPGGDS